MKQFWWEICVCCKRAAIWDFFWTQQVNFKYIWSVFHGEDHKSTFSGQRVNFHKSYCDWCPVLIFVKKESNFVLPLQGISNWISCWITDKKNSFRYFYQKIVCFYGHRYTQLKISHGLIQCTQTAVFNIAFHVKVELLAVYLDSSKWIW